MSDDKVVATVPPPGALTVSPEWQAKLAAHAKVAVEREKGGGQFFSTKGGVLSFQQTPVPGNKCQVVIMAAIHERVYYDGPFNAAQMQSPKCYAFSADGANMKPHADAEEPQSPDCASCKHNVWGSSDNGRGKACKEQRRLSLLPASCIASADEVASGMTGVLRVPVTSAKLYVAHAKHAANVGLPLWACVSEVKLSPDPKAMQRLDFTLIAPITDPAVLEALERRQETEMRTVGFPYVSNATMQVTQEIAHKPATVKARKF